LPTDPISPTLPSTPDVEIEELLTPEFLRKLERLSLVVSHAFAGRLHGERRSTRRGASVEFADFRNYAPGDDLRAVDWNVYARLEKLFLKLFVVEEDLHVHLLIDTSRSMGFGTPGKLPAARRLCAALGYITLNNLDRLTVTAVTDRLGMRLGAVRGKGQAMLLFSWLQALRAQGVTDFAHTLAEYAMRARTPGPVIVLSDFLAPGIEEGVRALVGHHFVPTLVRVIAPDEIDPPFAGDLRLVDAETGATREITITSGVLSRYRQRLRAHREMLEGICARYGVNYLEMQTDASFDQLVLRYLRARRVVA